MNGHFSLCFCLQLQSLCIILFKSQAQSYEAAETIRGALGNFNSNPVSWSLLVKTGETQPLMAGLSGSYQLSWFYLSTELTASVFKYDTLCTSWPPLPSDCFQLFLNPDSSTRQRGSSERVERFAVSLWRAFHFSGCDELLCSRFNSQHHIIGHHLGLSFSLSSSISFSSVSLTALSTCVSYGCSW